MEGRIARSERERAWVERTLEITLFSLGALAEAAARTATPDAIIAVRDLADHAAIWAERLGPGRDGPAPFPPREVPGPATGAVTGSLHLDLLLSRVAHGIGGRLAWADAPIGGESRRAAICCAADLELHARRADARIRRAERSGLGEAVRRTRAALPSQHEFLDGPAPIRDARDERREPHRPCPTAPRRASSAA